MSAPVDTAEVAAIREWSLEYIGRSLTPHLPFTQAINHVFALLTHLDAALRDKATKITKTEWENAIAAIKEEYDRAEQLKAERDKLQAENERLEAIILEFKPPPVSP